MDWLELFIIIMDVKNPYRHDSTDPLYFLVMCSDLCELTISQYEFIMEVEVGGIL